MKTKIAAEELELAEKEKGNRKRFAYLREYRERRVFFWLLVLLVDFGNLSVDFLNS
jgi:hypothetical protein